MANETPSISIDSTGVGFGPAIVPDTDARPEGGQAFDVDGDGDLDLVLNSRVQNEVTWLENDGQGGFGEGGQIASGYFWKVSNADIDGDGLQDVMGRLYNSETGGFDTLWYRNNGDGSFAEGAVITTAAGNPLQIVGVDFDGDGDTDVLTAAAQDGAVTLHLQGEDGSFSDAQLVTGFTSAYAVAVGDVDGDGRLDVVASNGNGEVGAWTIGADGTATQTFLADISPSYGVEAVQLADIDGDGKLDIVAADANTKQLSWLKGNGDGTFEDAVLVARNGDGFAGPTDFEVVDVDGDGQLDIVSASTSSETVSWYSLEDDGAFVEHVVETLAYPGASDFFDITVADLDGDGAVEIVSYGRAGNNTQLRIAEARPALGVDENSPTALTGLSFTDDGTGPVSVTLTVDRGTLAAESVDGVTVSVGEDGWTLTLEGTVADINAFVAGGAVGFLTARHDEKSVNLTVTIDDRDAEGAATATAEVVLVVEPMEDAAPVDLALSADTIAEDAAVGTVVGVLLATDPEGEQVTYALTSDWDDKFEIVGDELRLKNPLDFEAGGTHTITVAATDEGGERTTREFVITVEDVNEAPISVALSKTMVVEDAAAGTVVGVLSGTDPDGDALTYSIVGGSNAFEIVGNELVVKDLGEALIHDVRIAATDADGLTVESDFRVMVTDEDGNPLGSLGTIVIDASTATSGMDFEAFIRGGFTADATGGGFPVFDNGSAFSGEEMFIGYGEDATSKYVLAHGELEYSFGTHTVAGTIGTIEYGTRGEGSYDENGYFSGGDVELRITGLDLSNPVPTNSAEETEIEANGPVHNFALAYMYGAAASPTRLATYADSLDAYAQHFVGSAFSDVYAGTAFSDTIEGGTGDDFLQGLGGNDEIVGGAGSDIAEGGDGTDTFVIEGNRADYDVYIYSTTYVVSKITGETDTLRGTEYLRFDDVLVNLVTKEETPIGANTPPEDLALSATSVDEDAAAGTAVAELSASDADGDALTYTLEDDAGGRFALVTEGGVTRLVVAAPLDFESASSHAVTVAVSDGTDTVRETFEIAVGDVDDEPEPAMITIDASGSDGMDVEAFIRGGFLADTTGGGMPVFDNSAAFAGEEMMIGFGSETSSKYVLAHGELAYNFGTHTVSGEIGTIEYGTRGDGSYDADGYFTGGDALLRITGLDLSNGVPTNAEEEAEIEANGPVHNFAVAHMYGSGADQARLDVYADALDTYAQHFVGSAGGDVFTGTDHDDVAEGAGSRDWLGGGKGSDSLAGGGGEDWLKGGGGTDRIEGGAGVDKLWGQGGGDRFVFAEAEHAGARGTPDVIKDFVSGADRIQLKGIDADLGTRGNQALDFIGEDAFSGTAGELRVWFGDNSAKTMIAADLDGDGTEDFVLKLVGEHVLTAADFVL